MSAAEIGQFVSGALDDAFFFIQNFARRLQQMTHFNRFPEKSIYI
jgi:hypothetical protein